MSACGLNSSLNPGKYADFHHPRSASAMSNTLDKKKNFMKTLLTSYKNLSDASGQYHTLKYISESQTTFLNDGFSDSTC